MNPDTLIAKLGGRKYTLALYIVIAATVLRVVGMLDQTGMLSAWGSALALYSLANVSQKATAKKAASTASASSDGKE